MAEQVPPEETNALLHRIDDLLQEQTELRRRLEDAREQELQHSRFRIDRRQAERRRSERRTLPDRRLGIHGRVIESDSGPS